MKCWLCDSEITRENSAKEHIILNAIGGRRTVRGFICKACNNGKGRTWDAVVADQLHFFGVMLNIERQKGPIGSLQVESAKGESLIVDPGNKLVTAPAFKRETLPGGQIRIHMQDRTRKALEKRVKGLARKYPQADVEKWKINVGKRYDSTPYGIDLSYGGPEFDRSIVKSALALACSAGVDVGECRLAVDYLRDIHSEYNERLYLLCYQDELVESRTPGLPIHCLLVTGDPINRTLLAYVEFYGHVRRLICLSNTYQGERFTESYAINPITGNELSEVSIELDYSKFSQIAATQTPDDTHTGWSRVTNEVLSYCYSLARERSISEHREQSMHECLSELGLSPNNEWSDEEMGMFVDCITDKLTPLLQYFKTPLDFPEGFDPSQAVRGRRPDDSA